MRPPDPRCYGTWKWFLAKAHIFKITETRLPASCGPTNLRMLVHHTFPPPPPPAYRREGRSRRRKINRLFVASGLRGLPCLAEGIYWATGLSRTTPFTEGRLGVNNKASPPGRHQEQAPKQRCTFRPTTFSSVQHVHDHVQQHRPPHSTTAATPSGFC